MYYELYFPQQISIISNSVPPLLSTTNPYHTNESFSLTKPNYTHELFTPSTTQVWNTLPGTTQLNPSVNLLKNKIMNDTLVAICYYSASRKGQVNHSRLRLAISNLNYDLFRHNLLDDPVCSCGYPVEISEHFLQLTGC